MKLIRFSLVVKIIIAGYLLFSVLYFCHSDWYATKNYMEPFDTLCNFAWNFGLLLCTPGIILAELFPSISGNIKMLIIEISGFGSVGLVSILFLLINKMMKTVPNP